MKERKAGRVQRREQAKMPSYWWECDRNSEHRPERFDLVCGSRLVKFFCDLADSGWDQSRLALRCSLCSGRLRINYLFPRREALQLAVHHVVGRLYGSDEEGWKYLPMWWESRVSGEGQANFDLKYVGWSRERGYQARGLARPAIIKESDFADIAEVYERVVGRAFPC
jgi:hypothetical protein